MVTIGPRFRCFSTQPSKLITCHSRIWNFCIYNLYAFQIQLAEIPLQSAALPQSTWGEQIPWQPPLQPKHVEPPSPIRPCIDCLPRELSNMIRDAMRCVFCSISPKKRCSKGRAAGLSVANGWLVNTMLIEHKCSNCTNIYSMIYAIDYDIRLGGRIRMSTPHISFHWLLFVKTLGWYNPKHFRGRESKPKHSRSKISNPGWAGMIFFSRKPFSSSQVQIASWIVSAVAESLFRGGVGSCNENIWCSVNTSMKPVQLCHLKSHQSDLLEQNCNDASWSDNQSTPPCSHEFRDRSLWRPSPRWACHKVPAKKQSRCPE